MERFSGAFHQSDLKAYLKCPRSFYYNRVLGLDKEKVSMANLAGRAGHTALEVAHGEKEWRPEVLFECFMANLAKEQQWAIEHGQEIHGQVDPGRYQIMLREYASRPWNREAKVLAMEKSFFFVIKPAKTEYQFEGRIDQLLEIPVDTLMGDFPIFRNIGHQSVIIHRDTKFGRRKEVSKFELALDVQFDVYAYALAHGFFDDDNHLTWGAGGLMIIPDYHIKYHIEDHIPYESDAGPYLKEESTGGRVPCDLVPSPCLVGKSGKACEGKRSWCTKQRRGPGMYFTTRPESRLHQIPAELGRICASIRMGHYPRQLGELCFNYCQYRSTCESEVLTEMEAA